MKALVLRSTEVDPEPRTERVIRDLQEAGFTVELIFWNRTKRKIESQNESFTRVSYNKVAEYGLGWRNLGAQLAWQLWLSRKIFKEPNCLIYACDADTALIAAICRSPKKHTLIYDQFDQISSRFRSRFFQKVSNVIDMYISNRAELTVVAAVNRIFKTKSTILVVSNNPNLPLQPVKPRNLRKLEISYCGVLQEDRGLLEIIETVNSLSDIRLTLAGFGPLQKAIESKVSQSVNFLGRIEPTEVIKEYVKADVSYVAYDPRKANNSNTASSKIYESAIACTPCIVTEGTSLANIVKQFDIGWVIGYGDVVALRALLQELLNSKGPLIPNFDEKRKKFLKLHSSDKQHVELVAYLKKLKAEI